MVIQECMSYGTNLNTEHRGLFYWQSDPLVFWNIFQVFDKNGQIDSE